MWLGESVTETGLPSLMGPTANASPLTTLSADRYDSLGRRRTTFHLLSATSRWFCVVFGSGALMIPEPVRTESDRPCFSSGKAPSQMSEKESSWISAGTQRA